MQWEQNRRVTREGSWPAWRPLLVSDGSAYMLTGLRAQPVRVVGALLNNRVMASSAGRPAPDGDGWRDRLRGYLPSDEPHQVPAMDPTQLALQFELREVIPRNPSRWNGPVSETAKATPGDLGHRHRLGVRPVAQTARGWARSAASTTARSSSQAS